MGCRNVGPAFVNKILRTGWFSEQFAALHIGLSIAPLRCITGFDSHHAAHSLLALLPLGNHATHRATPPHTR
jgi:hypothetical protein